MAIMTASTRNVFLVRNSIVTWPRSFKLWLHQNLGTDNFLTRDVAVQSLTPWVDFVLKKKPGLRVSVKSMVMMTCVNGVGTCHLMTD